MRQRFFLPFCLISLLAACGSQTSLPSDQVASSGQLKATASDAVAEAAPAKPPVFDFSADPIAAFTERMLPHAAEAAEHLGVDPELIIAHAGLESGWGKKPILLPDGRNSHNLFSVKAYSNWDGDTVKVRTTEYEGGRRVKKVETFRAYTSYEEAFADYAQLLKQNGRYSKALGQGDNAQGFARGLQKGGYATDPRYVSKFANVARKVARASDKLSA